MRGLVYVTWDGGACCLTVWCAKSQVLAGMGECMHACNTGNGTCDKQMASSVRNLV